MSTSYPAAIDAFPEMFETSLEENSGQWWNELMDAIEAIQGELGVLPQGASVASLADLLNARFEADGDLLEFDSGTVTGTPTVGSPVTITFHKTFASAPYVFVMANADMTVANEGVICAVHTRTTTTCQLVARRRDGTDHGASRTYYWLAIDGSINTDLS
jgi:hypothetical protein